MSESPVLTERDLRRAVAERQARVESVEVVTPGSLRVTVSFRERSWGPRDPAERLAEIREDLRGRTPLGVVLELVHYAGAGPYRTPGGGG